MKNQYRIFIDGEAGTTGLQIRQRLEQHEEIAIVSIDPELRKNADEKSKLISSVDVTILCLPDDAARLTANLALSTECRILDASSAHRTSSNWIYGLPELTLQQRDLIHQAKLVSNPGCYSTGAILLLRPLIDAGLLDPDDFMAISAISGYSGGGKKLIEKYEDNNCDFIPSYAIYGLDFNHKHIPEIQTWSLLERRPLFLPSVGNFKQGMLVQIPLDCLRLQQQLNPIEIHRILDQRYREEQFINVMPYNEIEPETLPNLTPHGLNGTNLLKIFVFGSSDRGESLLVAKLDNLGKGASGAAVQNLNLMLGIPEHLGVNLEGSALERVIN